MYKVVQSYINIVQFNSKRCSTSKQILQITFYKILYRTCKLGCTIMCTMLYNLSRKGCTTPIQIFVKQVVRSFVKYCTVHCTTKHKLLHNIGQYVQYCTNLVQFPFQTHFSVVQLFKLFMEYNLLYNFVQPMYKVVQFPKNMLYN